MAIGDIKVLKGAGPVVQWVTDDRDTSSQTVALLPGEPVKVSTNYVIALASGDPEIGTDEFAGIVQSQSTETASADGVVNVYSMLPGLTQLRGKATTAGNVDTAAKLLGLINDWICIDVTGAGTNGPTGVFTFDEDEGTDPNVHAFKVVDGDISAGTLDVLVHANASVAPLTGQTMD
jgi:hypothetical protein